MQRILAAALFALLASQVHATPFPSLAESVSVCDPNNPTTCIVSGTLHEDDALTNTAVAIKASGGQLTKLYCYNPNATVIYVQIYNTAAASVTVGTTAHVQSYGIPATSSAGYAINPGDQYSTAISYAATTTPGGASAPGTALTCNVSYN